MVKACDAPYEISKRSNSWFKVRFGKVFQLVSDNSQRQKILQLKKDYLDTIGDSVDVVVVGAFSGKGKRAGTYGSYLCAVYNPKNGEFQTLCKVGVSHPAAICFMFISPVLY